MQELLPTLLPLSLFWIIEATFLGGWPVDVHGGKGFQQVLGLLITFVLWVVTWHGASRALAGLGPVLGSIVVATFATAFLTPVINWVGFKIVGVSVRRVAEAH
ncbi:MAG: hypothetical protein EXR93_04660 [Gemmatimonadetes bacterium]|nr:hypothetical protein [Gemmatimonadota bacterium]